MGEKMTSFAEHTYFKVKTSALILLGRHKGSVCFCLWVKGQSQVNCHNRLQAGKTQGAAELQLQTKLLATD